jgi:glycosyltransferase involved in cell wall biosynthesis
MKILLTVDPELPVPPGLYGGIERIVEVLVNVYIREGHDVILCANSASQVPCKLAAWPGIKSQHVLDTLKNAYMLARLHYREKVDIIHSFSRLAYMTALLPASVPKIMSYQREPSLAQIGKAVRLARKRSLVFTGCSNYISGQIKGIAEAHTIYNFAPIDRYKLETSAIADAPLVFLGRVEEIKGAHIAIEVAQRANRRLIIAGNIPPEKEAYFNEKIRPHLNDRITYAGPVNDVQKNEILGKAQAFLMPIQWNEPFGIVMAEAMACGTPVLGFPFGSVPEVIENGINGYVCRDTDEMVQRINDLSCIDRRAVRRIAEERFSDTRIVKDYLKLYATLIERTK